MPLVTELVGYPELRRFVTDSLSRLPQFNPKVFAAFVRFSQLDEASARRALLPTSGPRLIVRANNVRGYARYEQLDYIAIRDVFADEYEAAAMVHVANVNLLMESKLLHEMVHWGYTQRHHRADPKKPELGWQFEDAAYGGHVTATSLGLTAFISVPGNF